MHAASRKRRNDANSGPCRQISSGRVRYPTRAAFAMIWTSSPLGTMCAFTMARVRGFQRPEHTGATQSRTPRAVYSAVHWSRENCSRYLFFEWLRATLQPLKHPPGAIASGGSGRVAPRRSGAEAVSGECRGGPGTPDRLARAARKRCAAGPLPFSPSTSS